MIPTRWAEGATTLTLEKGTALLAVADLHGHVELLDRAMAAARAMIGPDRHLAVVTVGDYVDNGSRVVELVDRLMQLHTSPPPNTTVRSIIGNHDMAFVLAATDAKAFGARRHDWYARWTGYWNADVPNTAAQYVGHDNGTVAKPLRWVSAQEFRAAIRPDHLAFLKSLPWVLRVRGHGSTTDNYTFVHAGLHMVRTEPLAVQMAMLEAKSLRHLKGGWLPDQLHDKGTVPHTSDPAWRTIVVSGHTKFANGRDFVRPNRLTFYSGACQGESLHCALLDPEATTLSDKNMRAFSIDSTHHRVCGPLPR